MSFLWAWDIARTREKFISVPLWFSTFFFPPTSHVFIIMEMCFMQQISKQQNLSALCVQKPGTELVWGVCTGKMSACQVLAVRTKLCPLKQSNPHVWTEDGRAENLAVRTVKYRPLTNQREYASSESNAPYSKLGYHSFRKFAFYTLTFI